MPALFAAALLAGASYWPASHILAHGALLAAWKGAGVGLLALWALLAGGTGATRWIAAVLACGAIGDVLLEAAGLSVGAVAFFAGHVLAAVLYWRERRGGGGRVIAVALAAGLPLVAYALSRDLGVLLYSLGLGAMAGTAWMSRFPRALVGGGGAAVRDVRPAALHADGPLAGSALPGLLIWPLYLAGQAMIACGVVRTEQAT